MWKLEDGIGSWHTDCYHSHGLGAIFYTNNPLCPPTQDQRGILNSYHTIDSYLCSHYNIIIMALNLQSETNPLGSIDQSVSCDQMMAVYEGQVCLSELTKWQQCFSPQSSAIYLPSDTNQEEAEVTANSLLLSLPLLSPSPECEAVIRPFLCLYLFGSCDSDNQPHRGTQSTCERLRDDVCAQEWALAEMFLGQGVLPHCDDLQQERECQSIRGNYLVIIFYHHKII